MEIKETRKVTEIMDVTIGYKCDECGKVHEGETYPDTWYEFSAYHNGWGNDSCDSYEYYLSCSPKCYYKSLSKAVEEFKYEDTSVIDDKPILFVQNLVKHIEKINTQSLSE